MDLEVRWTEFAQDRLHDVFEYYKYKAGVKISQKLVNDLVDESLRLEKNPFIGQVEELLNDRIQTYRHLIFKNYKIIYWVDEVKKVVYVSHLFDTRQNPLKMKSF